jgi:hypothetical protein
MNALKAIAVGVAVGLTLGLSVPPAEAHPDRNQAAYIIAKVTYKTVSNDDYLRIFQKAHFRMNGQIGDILAHAADDVCHKAGGKLEEDFSCS